MSEAADAAMAAITNALRTPDEEREAIASAAEVARSNALTTVIKHFRGEDQGREATVDALETLALQIGHTVVPEEDWDEDGLPSCDEDHLAEALSRAQLGQIDDCLHHLERALPQGYGIIAERLAGHFRSRP